MGGWFYNSTSGTVNKVPTLLEPPYLIPGIGWHELKIPYSSTRAQAIAAASKEYPGGATPGGSLAGNAGQDAGNAAQSAILGSSGVPSVIRIAEMLLGIVLIGIGLARITGTQNIVSQAVKTRIP